MKCTNKLSVLVVVSTIVSLLLTGCSFSSIDTPFDPDSSTMAYRIQTGVNDSFFKPFAAELCVTDEDIKNENITLYDVTAAACFGIKDSTTYFSQNANKRMNPASTTKILTALIAIKYGNPEDVLTASSNVYISESGAQLAGLQEGDRLTLDQALHALMIYSANDAAVMIAEYISGSVEEFAGLMNKTAYELGATNSHFVNPHGLTNEEHYTTAYDLYLIFQEAMKYDTFRNLIGCKDYSTEYHDREGNVKTFEFHTTNGYLSGDFETPSGLTVIGGKTGTTGAAGYCLILLSEKSAGDDYVSVVLQAPDRNSLYGAMSSMLSNI